MTESLELDFLGVKPPSANHCRKISRNKPRKTEAYKRFEEFIFYTMLQDQASCDRFEEQFKREDHCLTCRMIIEIPAPDFVTKKNEIKKSHNDLDNFVKCFIDSVFKNFNELDDSQICQMVAFKKVSKDGSHNARMKLSIDSIEEIY